MNRGNHIPFPSLQTHHKGALYSSPLIISSPHLHSALPSSAAVTAAAAPMGCNVRGRSIRTGRRSRYTAKPPSPAIRPPQFPADPRLDLNLTATPPPNPNPSAADAPDSDWGYCTEEQLEDTILRNLDLVYHEALARLISVGYDETTARNAILSNGYCYGSNDVLSSILNNAISFLNSPPTYEDLPTAYAFTTLRQLEEYSLTNMLAILQQVRPQLTRGDAMWCLLMSDLHVGRASTLQIPGSTAAEDADSDGEPAACCPRHRRRAASGLESLDSDIVGSVLKSLESMSIEETPNVAGTEEQKKEMILDLVRKIRELEVQVSERKEWAQQKALQAAQKVSSDLAELNNLRAEREENQLAKKGKPGLDDSTMKRLSDMEAALKRASGDVDRANSVVRKLENENAEMRAEMEASKLSASESAKMRQEVEKREKRCLKRLQAWEKQRDKLKEDIAEERRKIAEVEQELNGVLDSNKQAEMKWRQAIKAKELAIALVEEERRAREAAEVSIKRRHESLRQKIELDFQRHKDDIQRLEEELSRLKASAMLSSVEVGAPKLQKEANSRTVKGFNKPKPSPPKKNRSRECVICMQEEVSVVLLPCAHQVLCPRCNEEHEKKAKAGCPCCNVLIEERIRVFGANS